MKALETIAGVYFCAGARNQSLLDIFHGHELKMEIDERSASFKALGLSKATRRPVIICTTSGTAVSECLSALIEAHYSESKLILISADRPLKLHNTGAPQTIDHKKVTSGYVQDYIDMPLEDLQGLDLSALKFPAHLNVRITSKDEQGPIQSPRPQQGFEEFMRKTQRPLFLFSHESQSLRPLVEKFLSKNIPFYAEVASNAKDLSSIKTEKKLLNLFKEQAFDGIIRIGHTPLNKMWRLLESSALPVYSFDSRGLPALSFGEVQVTSGLALLEDSTFWRSLPQYERPILDESVVTLANLLTKYPCSELSFVKKIHDSIPAGSNVFLGNSLTIRNFEQIQSKPFKIMANRGANGIDGQLSTAMGWCASTNEVIYCLIGDMTFFYDLGSLINFPANLKCIVINNGGGRIFENLKMDKRLVMEHPRHLSQICQGLGPRYSSSLKDLSSSQVIEVTPDLNQSRLLLQEWGQ